MIDPEIEREFANIRAQFARELACHREVIDQRDATRMETLKEAMLANEKNRQAMNDAGGRMMTRQEAEASISVVAERVEQNRVAIETRLEVITKPIAERVEENRVSLEARFESIGRPNWALMASLGSIALVLIGGAWALTGLKFEASVAPVSLKTEQVTAQVALNTDRLRTLETATAGSAQADASSRVDRAQLNERLRSMENLVPANAAERRSQFAVMNAKLVEIETQFCASDIVRNLLHANDMRIQSLLWAKSYPGDKMPTDNAFYPRICNRVPSVGE